MTTPARSRASSAPGDGEMLPTEFIRQFADDPDFVTSLARGLAVLHAFSQKRRHMSIAQVSHRTGIPRAAARRSLHTLALLGYVAIDDADRFFLRPKILALADAYLSATPLAVLAQPILDRLSDKLQESCSIGILDGDEVVYLARSVSSRIFSTTLNVGRRLPAYCTSIGIVMLGELSRQALDDYLARVRLYPYTERTVTAPQALKQSLHAAMKSGYAISDQQWEPRITTMAVPVRDTSGQVIAGVNVLLQAGRVPLRDMPERFLLPLQEAAHELGRMLLP